MENFSDVIAEQNEAYDALLALERTREESARSLQRRMAAADDLLGPEPAPDHEKAVVVIRIYTADQCYTRRFTRSKNLLEAIHLYLASRGHEAGDLSTYGRRVIKKPRDLNQLIKSSNGRLALYFGERPR